MPPNPRCAFCAAVPLGAAATGAPVSRGPLGARRARARARPRAPAMQYADLDAVRGAVRLSDAFSTVTEVRARGGSDEFMAVCPFHADGTPSLSISDARARFHCFGCGARGDLLEFERRLSGAGSVPAAVAALAARFPAVAAAVAAAPRARAPPPGAPPPPPRRAHVAWGADAAARRAAAATLRAAVRVTRAALAAPGGAPARAYLAARGVGALSAGAFRVGCAPGGAGWSALLDALAAEGVRAEEAVAAGLAGVSRAGTPYDLFRGRVVFPICDVRGDPVGLAGRLLAPSDRAPKYINSRESALFRKKDALFGAHLAAAALAPLGPRNAQKPAAEPALVVVEGYMDVIALYEHSQGQVPAVATMGTAVSHEQVAAALALLPGPADGRVIVNFDADEAGVTAVERLCDVVLSEMPESFRVAIAFPPEGAKDADEYLSKGMGSAEDYLAHLNDTAVLWPKWRGRRILDKELDRIAAEKGEETIDFSSPEAIERSLRDGVPQRDGRETSDDADSTAEKLVVRGLPAELDDESEEMFNFQLNEALSREHDKLMLAYGAPKEELQKRYAYRKEFITLDCSPDIIEDLSVFLATAERCLVGLNSSELIQSWADALSGAQSAAIPAIFELIAERTTELNAEWAPFSPETHVRWMPPAPYILSELPKRERERVLRSLGREEEGDDMSLEQYLVNPQSRKPSMKRFDFQSATIEPLLRSRRCAASKRMEKYPRRAVEERVLRALIFCNEVQRLDALDKLLNVMVRCEEGGLRFWTSAPRQELFAVLSEVEGDLEPEDIAALCEDKPWWSDDIEDLFLPDDPVDVEWAEIRQIDLDRPVVAVEMASRSIESMEKRVRGRLAVDEMGSSIKGALKAREEGDFDEMDRNIARQMLLKNAIADSRNLSEREQEEERKREERKKKEEDHEQAIEEMKERLLRGDDIPIPEHFIENNTGNTAPAKET